MLDLEPQRRFVKSATDAMFNFASVGLAVGAAWQEMLSKGQFAAIPSPAQMTYPSFASNPVADAFSMWSPAALSFPAMVDPFGIFATQPARLGSAQSNPFFDTAFCAFAVPSSSAFEAMVAWNDAARSMWPGGSPSWLMWQVPMTTMFMQAGMPLAVARPCAKASAATLDCVDAARDSVNSAVSAYRTDGGQAAAMLFGLPIAFMASVLPATPSDQKPLRR